MPRLSLTLFALLALAIGRESHAVDGVIEINTRVRSRAVSRRGTQRVIPSRSARPGPID
jgi:hypothetical protein